MKLDGKTIRKILAIIGAGALAIYGEVMSQKSEEEVEDLKARIEILEKRQ